MSTDANKGKAALEAKDYPLAISHLTAALKTSQSPLWLIQRSSAYQRNNQHELALADADNAVLAAMSRARRELIATAQFRRAVALHGLGRFGDARMCLHWCKKSNEKEKGLTLWMGVVAKDYEKSGGDEAECNQVTVMEKPEPVKEVTKVAKHDVKKENVDLKGKRPEAAAAASTPAAPAQTPKEKVRHEWYQSTNTVTIEIFAKGVPKETAVVKIDDGSLDVSFPIAASNSTYAYSLEPLFSKIDSTKSTYRITPHKIEIVLHKSLPGQKWSSLEGSEAIPSSAAADEPAAPIPSEVISAKASAPSYPTSSRKGPKNWDKLAVGEGEDEDESNPDDFFKKLYQGLDPDSQKAMMKSYTESNGTSLSTDWKDVGSRTFETQPPEGLEAKKWDS